MTFYISKVKNTIVLVGIFVVWLCGALLYFLLIPRSLRYSFYILSVAIFRNIYMLIQDYKTEISFAEKGLTMYRRGKYYNLKWDDVQNVSYSGIRGIGIFDTLVIQTTQGKLYIENTFEDYKGAWLQLKHHIEKYSPNATIEDDIPFYD